MSQSDKVTRELFAEIKAAQEDGVNTVECAKQQEMSIRKVNIVFQTAEFDDLPEDIKEEEEQFPEDSTVVVEKVQPGSSNRFKGLIARKQEENSNLKESRGFLLEQVGYLRKAVVFLEGRHKELQDGIKDMEKIIYKGIDAVEQLEENNSFEKLSPPVVRKNT